MKQLKTLTLAVALYKNCQKLSLKGAIRNQLERAMLSVPLNLAEGSAKPSAKERRKFYHIALGSLREVQTVLMLIGNNTLQKEADFLGAHLYRLCKNT